MDPTTPVTGTAQTTQTQDKYQIPQAVKDKYPEIIDMILKTESMSEQERQYWFQILPIMTQEQVDRLKNILQEESKQLAKLNEEYQGELGKINDKHMTEWDTLKKAEERQKRTEAEAVHEVEEKKEEEDILKQLGDA